MEFRGLSSHVPETNCACHSSTTTLCSNVRHAMLPKTKDGEIDTYLLGAPVALGAILSVIALVLLMFRCSPEPLGKTEREAAQSQAKASGGAQSPAPAPGAH